MTAPTTAAGVTNPYTLTPGAAPVRITDGTNNSPAGLTLVNRGDNGQNVWIMGGPAAQSGAVPLGPAASLQWSDPVNLPYAYVTGAGALAETLVVSSQSAGYSNPATVAGTLIAQGIPSTMVDTGLGSYRINAGFSTAGITVGQCSGLIVTVEWSQPAPQGANAVRLRFDDPAIPDLPPIDFYCTNNNAIEETANTWQVPVVAPRLTVANLVTPDNNNAAAAVQIVGNNRPPVGGFRQLGQRIGTKTVYADIPTANALVTARAYAGDAIVTASGVNPGTGPMTRFNGPVTLNWTVGNISGGGLLSPAWVDETGRITATRLFFIKGTEGQNDFQVQWNHPSVPVWWRYDPLSSLAGNYFRLTVTGAG